MMSTATPGLGQNPEGMVTSAQSSVAGSNMGLTFSGVGTGSHNMSVPSMDQQDNAAVSTNLMTLAHASFVCQMLKSNLD